MYFIGNCYCWAHILKLFYGGKITTVSNEPGNKFRHYILVDRNGKIRHFKRVFNILPPPACYFFFVGKIEFRDKKKKDLSKYKIYDFSFSGDTPEEIVVNFNNLKNWIIANNKTSFSVQELPRCYIVGDLHYIRMLSQLLAFNIMFPKYIHNNIKYDSLDDIDFNKYDDVTVRYYLEKHLKD